VNNTIIGINYTPLVDTTRLIPHKTNKTSQNEKHMIHNLLWDKTLYGELKSDTKLLLSLFEEQMMKPFIICLDNPYSFLWTFGVFLSLNLGETLLKNEEIYLVPLESHFFPYTPFLVLNKIDWQTYEIEGKLNKQQQKGVLILAPRSCFAYKPFLASQPALPFGLRSKGGKTKNKEYPHNWVSYSLPENEKESMEKDLQLGRELDLQMVQTCRKNSAYSLHYFAAFLKRQHPSFSFGKPLLNGLALVNSVDLKDEAFFKCGEIHPIELDKDEQHYLEKCARFMKLRCRDYNPVLAPVRGSLSPHSFIYFPSDVRGDFNDYFAKLSEREKRYCIAYDNESFF
jgi:hypothetical protein